MIVQTGILLIVVLVVLVAFFSAAEAALLSLGRFKVRYMVEKKRSGANYVKKLKDDPERLLSTILIGNTLVSIGASAIATSIALETFKNSAIGIATGIMTFVILVFGEVVPKTIAIRNNELFSLIAARFIWWLSIILYPLVTLLDYFLQAINVFLGTKKISIITREELKSIVKLGEEEGSIKEVEKRMIHRIFDFDNTTVSDVMTGKKHMVMVGADMQIKDVLQLPMVKLYSRFPVYDKNKDNIVGILYLKDMLKSIKDNKLDVPAKQIMRKPLFIFSHRKIDTTLRLFQNRKQHLAIVIDNKARVVGLVTIENILEEIVGEIIDESDKIDPPVHKVSEKEWYAKGTSEIDEINAKTGMSIKESDFENLDTFIFTTLGRSPKEGEEINYQNYKFVIEEIQGKKILKAKILKV